MSTNSFDQTLARILAGTWRWIDRVLVIIGDILVCVGPGRLHMASIISSVGWTAAVSTISATVGQGGSTIPALCKLEDEGPGSDAAVCGGRSVATSVDGVAIAGRTDSNISRISLISRRRSATAASEAARCC